jgi:hypothetical protein
MLFFTKQDSWGFEEVGAGVFEGFLNKIEIRNTQGGR